MRVRWSATALADLRQLRAHIGADNPRAAQAIAQRIRSAVDRLASFPGLGRPGRLPETRELTIPGTRYFVVYAVADEAVRILAVIHSARQWPPGS